MHCITVKFMFFFCASDMPQALPVVTLGSISSLTLQFVFFKHFSCTSVDAQKVLKACWDWRLLTGHSEFSTIPLSADSVACVWEDQMERWYFRQHKYILSAVISISVNLVVECGACQWWQYLHICFSAHMHRSSCPGSACWNPLNILTGGHHNCCPH